MGTAADAVAYFRSLTGTGEQPPGSNNVPGITDFLRTKNGSTTGPSAWCAETVSKVLDHVGCRDLYGLQFANGTAWVPHITAHYRSIGRWGTEPKQGALAVCVWGGSGSNPAGDHVGMATDDGSWHTIEGNSHVVPGGPDVVGEHDRPRGEFLGFAYPQYDPAAPNVPTPQPPPPPPPPAHVLTRPYPGRLYQLTSPMTHDDNVRAVQQRLHDLGYALGNPTFVDGWYGEQTAGIVWDFQRDVSDRGLPLTKDSVVGPATWTALFTV